MRVGRLILVVATLVTILVFPLLIRDAIQALKLPNAYAAPGTQDPNGRVYQNGNNDDNDNNNNNNNNNNGDDDDDDEDNDNAVCYSSLNDNEEEVPCEDNGNYDDTTNDNVIYDNTNDNDTAPPYTPPPAAPAPPAPGPMQTASKCYSVGELGDVSLVLPGGTITIRVVNPGGFAQAASVKLDAVDPTTVPAPTGGATLTDSLVWRMSAGSPCDGPAINALPNDVNLGIPYNVSANKAKLQIVRLENNAWVEVPTVPDPDPNKPYISATVHDLGTYAVIQKP